MEKPKRMSVVWFVRCPSDDTKAWQFSMFPQIYHVCAHCGASVHNEKLPRLHEVREAQFKQVSGSKYAARLDEVCANPEPYFVD